MKGDMKVIPPIFFLETIITVTMKFMCIMGTSFTKWRLFFHKISFNIITLFPTLCETLYAGYIKLFAEALELFMRTVFQFVVICKTVSSECVLQGAKLKL
jgi:hypothetical protein